MGNFSANWSQDEDLKVLAGSVLRIPAREVAARFLPGRTPEAINMRLSTLRHGNGRSTIPRIAETHSGQSIEDMDVDIEADAVAGSQMLLIAILRWAAAKGTSPPGLSAERTRELCLFYGIDIPGDGLKLRMMA